MEHDKCHNVTCRDEKHQADRRDYDPTKEWSPAKQTNFIWVIGLSFAAIIAAVVVLSSSPKTSNTVTVPNKGYSGATRCDDVNSVLCRSDFSFMKKPDALLSRLTKKVSERGNAYFSNYKR